MRYNKFIWNLPSASGEKDFRECQCSIERTAQLTPTCQFYIGFIYLSNCKESQMKWKCTCRQTFELLWWRKQATILNAALIRINLSFQLKARIQELEKLNRELLSKLSKLSDAEEKVNVSIVLSQSKRIYHMFTPLCSGYHSWDKFFI